MRIGTAEPNSTFLSQGRALKTVLESRGIKEPIDVLESPGASTENAMKLQRGELDFGFMASNWIGRARQGQAPFEAPIDLRMVALANAGPLFFIARKNSPIASVSDLRGKKIAVGLEKSGMKQHSISILGGLGIDFTPVHLDFLHGGQALEAGEVDAQLQCPIPNPIMTDLDGRTELKVLPYEAGQLDTVLSKVSYYRPVTMRKGALRALTQDVAQPAVVNVFVAHAATDANMVNKVAHVFFEDAKRLPQLNALYNGLPELFEPLRTQGAAAFEFDGVRLHDGAAAAYRELGLLA